VEKTAADRLTICIFCNIEQESIQANYHHMQTVHNLAIPFCEYLKDISIVLRLIIKKIFSFNCCLGCDSQGFAKYRALQNHIVFPLLRSIKTMPLSIPMTWRNSCQECMMLIRWTR
jgi:hypothetical protein